jgi:Flp pilus assembly protein TadG
MTGRARHLLDDRSGAVLVETVIVFVPLLTFFLAVLQVLEIGAANLVIKRAASVAARAAIVVLPDSEEYYPGSGVNSFSGKRSEEIHEAARMILATNSSFVASSANVTVTPAANNDPLTATVSARFRCGVMCLGGSVRLSGSATHTYQGAKYSYDYGNLSDFNPTP